MSLDQQHAALLIPVPRIHGIEQARALHQPWTEIAIDVQHENQILVFEISADRRVMAAPRAKDHLAVEINDVTMGRVIGALQMFSEFFWAHIPKYSHAAMRLHAREPGKFIQRQAHYAE